MPRDSAKLGRRDIFVDAGRLRTLWDTPTFSESGSALAATPPSTLSQSSSNVSACTAAYGAISPCRAFLYTDAIDGLTIMSDTGAIMFAAGDNASNARLTGGGQLHLTTTGSGAGALLGGGAHLWRKGAG